MQQIKINSLTFAPDDISVTFRITRFTIKSVKKIPFLETLYFFHLKEIPDWELLVGAWVLWHGGPVGSRIVGTVAWGSKVIDPTQH
jgi:hypothetical protein